jgi:hypothetical protein
MKNIALFTFLSAIIIGIWACTPTRGCMEETADNFDAAAEENDGTCIASRDKFIGSYRYTRIWNDVILAIDTIDVGTVTITEANTAGNAFVMNFNGNLAFQGSSSAFNIIIKQRSVQDTFFGQFYNRTYSGTGTWLEMDTVDLSFNLQTQVPMWNGASPPGITTVPQVYNYYCTKTL